MNEIKKQRLIDLLDANNGIVKTSILNKSGFMSRDIKLLTQEGFLLKIKQGYYIWNEKQDNVSDIEIISMLIPTGVLCLFTAVDYYELSTINPAEICIALPRGANCPNLPTNFFIKVYYMTKNHFEAGITETEFNGTIIRMFDMEKTVCDCFKYDNEVEKAVALEVLKNYLAKGNCNLQKLLEYAKLLGKKKVIYPYVEALI